VKPQLTPKILAALCGKTVVDQARHAGLERRQFLNLIKEPWSQWRIKYAEGWCAGCGVDFYDLKLDALLPRIDFARMTERTKNAIRDLCRIGSGKPPTAADLKQFVEILENRKAALK